MDRLPLFLDVKGRYCLVVGGDFFAYKKAHYLYNAGAQTTIISNSLCTELQNLIKQKKIKYINQPFTSKLLSDCYLVIAANDDTNINQKIYTAAKQLNIRIEVKDQAEISDFVIPEIIDHDPILIAADSNNTILTRSIIKMLEKIIPSNFGKLAKVAGQFRDELKKALPSVTARRYFWESIFNSNKIHEIQHNSESSALEQLRVHLQNHEHSLKNPQGEVYIVGAGPGNADLLTFKALSLLQQADVILYDYLVSNDILELGRRDADKICVGKKFNHHSKTQDEINQLLIDLAQKKLRVCRLKGGDPFIFGRGAEEIEALVQAGIRFQVVPGITAAAGCASYAGIPLTHRDYAQSCVFITGHSKHGELAIQDDIDWSSLTLPNQTLVFYMSLNNLSTIATHLKDHGMPSNTPIALIENGTTAKQRVTLYTLAELNTLPQKSSPDGPTLIIIGKVVAMHHQLSWFKPEM